MTYLTLLNLDPSSRQHHRRAFMHLTARAQARSGDSRGARHGGGWRISRHAQFGKAVRDIWLLRTGAWTSQPSWMQTDHDQFLTSRAASRCSRPRVHRTQLLGAVAEDCQLAIAECLDVRDSMAHLFWLISIIWLILRNILSHPA